MNPIFDFLDYRAYLKAYYTFRKENEKRYTFRAMAGEMGFASSNYLMLVMQGKRNLGGESLAKIIQGLGLSKREGEYLSCLVRFDQAKDSEEKNRCFGEIAAYRTRSDIVRLEADKFNYYDKWYNPVVREVVKGLSAKDPDYAAIAKSVSPAILPKEAKKSLRLLQDLDLITVTRSGKFTQTSDLINTEPEIQTLAVRNFHRRMSDLGKEAINQVDPEAREISSLTVRISGKGFLRLKSRLQEFREELLRMVKQDKGDDRVYQLNFQFFPVSTTPLDPGDAE